MNNWAKVIIRLIVVVVVIGGGYWFFVGRKEAPAVEENKLKIGALLTLTGGGGFAGEDVKLGMDLAMRKPENQERIKLYYEDSATDPKLAVSGFNKLADIEKADMVVVTLSAMAEAVTPIAIEKKIPILQTLVSAPNIAAGSPYTFRYFHSADTDAAIGSQIAKEIIKAKTASILHLNDAYGRSHYEFFKKFFTEGGPDAKIGAGGKIVSEQSFTREDSDFRAHLTKVKETNPDVLYFVGLEKSVAQILKQARELKIKSALLANAVMAGPSVQEASGENDEGVYLVSPSFYFDQPTEVAKKFIEEYKAAYSKEPSHYAAIGYDIVNLFAKIQKEPADTSDDIIRKLTAIGSMTGAMGELTIDPEGEIAYPLYPAQIRNQKLEKVEL